MTLDATLRPLAKRLHRDYGKESTLTVRTGGGYDASDGSYDAPSEANHTVFCTPPQPFHRSVIDGDRVRQDDFTTSVAAQGLSVVPDTSAKLTFDGAVYAIVGVTPVYSGAQIAAYLLHCRK